jgi:hypothetical protein
MNLYKIKETELYKNHFPVCVCIYQNIKKKYCMAEINTGLYKGTIKIISDTYNTYDELKNNYNTNNTNYPVLFNHIIYNNL